MECMVKHSFLYSIWYTVRFCNEIFFLQFSLNFNTQCERTLTELDDQALVWGWGIIEGDEKDSRGDQLLLELWTLVVKNGSFIKEANIACIRRISRVLGLGNQPRQAFSRRPCYVSFCLFLFQSRDYISQRR